IYNLTKPIALPKKEVIEALGTEKRLVIYCGFLKNALDKNDVSDKKIQHVVKQLATAMYRNESREQPSKGFDWLPLISLLWELTIGSKPLAVVRLLKMLYMNCESDVNKCLEKATPNRAGKLSEVLKNIISRCSCMIRGKKMTPYQNSRYCHTVAALCSYYVDLCCVYSSKVLKKKQYGRDVCGFVSYVLRDWPQHLIEVPLQLSKIGPSTRAVVLPLAIKCLESKPSMNDHEHYLKYLLLARKLNENIGQDDERLQECWMEVKKVPASQQFLSWLEEQCPDTMGHLPKEDRKFKGLAVTHFLLADADEELISLLYQLLSGADHPQDDDNGETEGNIEALEVTEDADLVPASEGVPTESLFFIDKAGTSAMKSAGPCVSPKKPIVLKSLDELGTLLDAGVIGDGSQSPQTFVLDPQLIQERVGDPESQRFFQSEIVSITSIESVGSNLKDEFGEFYVSDDPSSEIESDVECLEETKRDKKLNGENDSGLIHEVKDLVQQGKEILENYAFDESDIRNSSAASSLTLEDLHQVKSVVHKVSPKKEKQERKMTPQKKKQEREMSPNKKASRLKNKKGQESDSESVASSSVILCDDSEDDLCQLQVEDNDLPSESFHENSVKHSDVERVDTQSPSTVNQSMTDEETSSRRSPGKKPGSSVSPSVRSTCKDDMESSLASTSSYIRKSPRKAKKLDTSSSLADTTADATEFGIASETGDETFVVLDIDSESMTEVNETQMLSSTVAVSHNNLLDKADKYEDKHEDDIIEDTPIANEKGRGPCKSALPNQILLQVGTNRNITVQSSVQELHEDYNSTDEVFQSPRSAKKMQVLKSPKQNKSEEKIGRKPSKEESQPKDEANLRSASTEEIFEIVCEIKEKLKSPKRKSELHGASKEESMFTDESIESVKTDEVMDTKKVSEDEENEEARRKSDRKTPNKTGSKTFENMDIKKSESQTLKKFERKTPKKSDSKKSDSDAEKSDVIISKKCESKTPNKSDSKTPNKSDRKTPNKSDNKTPHKSESKTPNRSDSKSLNKSDSKTPNKSDSKSLNKSDSKTPNKSHSKTSSISDSKTPNKSCSKTPNKSDSKTPSKSDSKTSKTSDSISQRSEVLKEEKNKSSENKFSESDEDFVLEKTHSSRKTKNNLSENSASGSYSPVTSVRKTPRQSDIDVPKTVSDRETPRKSDANLNENTTTQGISEMENAYCDKNEDSMKTDEFVMKKIIVSDKSNTSNHESTPVKSNSKVQEVEYVPSSQKKLKGIQITEVISDSDSEHESLPDLSKYVKSPTTNLGSPQKHPQTEITPSKVMSPVRSPKLQSQRTGKEKISDTNTKLVAKRGKGDEEKMKEVEGKHKQIVPEEEKESPPKRPRRSLRPKAKESDNESDVQTARQPSFARTDTKLKAKLRDKNQKKTEIAAEIESETTDQSDLEEKVKVRTDVPTARQTPVARTDTKLTPAKYRGKTQKKSETAAGIESETTDQSDLDGKVKVRTDVPTARQTPVTRSDTKQTPAKSRGMTPKKTESAVVIESDTTDQSDMEGQVSTRVSSRRRSVAPTKMTAIKEKPSEETIVDEVAPLPSMSTPERRPATRKLSASTSKKMVTKVEALQGTRKRRLSGEMSDQANSTDSEVSFPKAKKVQESKTTIKRLSTPAGSSSLNQSTESTTTRYSLRKK
ncbi:hypothetical protein DPMN_012906, partial [Dreissena polymorpha]